MSQSSMDTMHIVQQNQQMHPTRLHMKDNEQSKYKEENN